MPCSPCIIIDYSLTEIIHSEIDNFFKRMGWPVNSASDEARMKCKTAIKFLIPMKFDVNRAINLYRAHENVRRAENLDHIWIKNPQLIREIQSNRFFCLRQLSTEPLIIYFAVGHPTNSTSITSLSQQERELISLQALICQLDVATESADVQQSGLNFIYDMQNCSASQFEMSLSNKILKLLRGTYPAMVKNIYIISAPKWFKIAYKVMMCTPDNIRDILTTNCGYSLDDIPKSLGGVLDPLTHGDTRYRECLSIVTDSRSICYPYYNLEPQPTSAKPSSNILFFNNDHHHHHQNQETASASAATTTSSSSSPTSLVAIVALRRNHESSQVRVRKRESSSSTDSEKRRRSNESLIEEEPPTGSSFTYIPQEISVDQSQSKKSSVLSENSCFASSSNQDNVDYQTKNSMSESESREHGVLKRDPKRTTSNNLYKPLTSAEFLKKSQSEIRQEFRKLPNPPAKDTHVAKEDRNLDKNRYRDVLPGEATRVKLQPDDDDRNDFINANYVSGHNNQEKAYIFTQGPLQHTVKDFWRMIWQENIAIIVMTTNIREGGTVKCYPYWPTESNDMINAGLYQVEYERAEKFDSFVISTLILRKKNHLDQRIIYHAHYLKWPDHGVPSNTKDALLFLDKVEQYQQSTMTKAPILLHCSAGIGRTGTFCAIDIGIKRYLERNIIDVPSTVMKMRTERSGSVQTEDQYVFAYLALMDYIKQQQALQERISEPIKVSAIDLIDKSDGIKPKDDHNVYGVDDQLRKGTRSKTNRKKSHDLDKINTLPISTFSQRANIQESTTYRGKTLSDSSVSAVQYLAPSTTNPSSESTRQRSSTEHISSKPTTTGNVHHKKARK